MVRSRSITEELDRLKGIRSYEDFGLIIQVAKSTPLERIRNKSGDIICSRYFMDMAHVILYDHISSSEVKFVENMAREFQSDMGASALIDTRSGIYVYMDLKKAPNYVNSDYSCLRDHARNLLKRSYAFR
jgi:hypothetical protein